MCVGTVDLDCVQCETVATCPQPSSAVCLQAACTNGVCGTEPRTTGTCDPGVPLGPCQEAVCSANGTCGIVTKRPGSSCDDGNACTTGDQCNELGQCVGTQIANCVSCQGNDASGCPKPSSAVCLQATCTNGVCGTAPRTSGTCNDDNPCTTNDQCNAAGLCVGTAVDNNTACTGGTNPKRCCGGVCCNNRGSCVAGACPP